MTKGAEVPEQPTPEPGSGGGRGSEYLAQIAECRRLAAETNDPLAKAAYEAMAAELLAKAQRAARAGNGKDA